MIHWSDNMPKNISYVAFKTLTNLYKKETKMTIFIINEAHYCFIYIKKAKGKKVPFIEDDHLSENHHKKLQNLRSKLH